MTTVDLLSRIDHRLDDNRHRIQPTDFEDCAIALIAYDYPGLVPVTGGTDHGLDAELIKPNGQVLGLIVTSSRRWEGARASLRGSLDSARAHGQRVDQVIVANLSEINRQKRIKLADMAREFGCDLIQVYDRAWFANAFRDNPEWRRRILQIQGGAFSLSRSPRAARPDEHQLPTVGREDLLDQAAESDQDLILWGVPGAGKSHVAGRLRGALFLERNTAPERLLDDLLSASPTLVVVDDAGGRADDLEHLLHARRAEDLKFRVVATCWPHEIESVADSLPNAVRLEVDLLTVEEIGTLLRERGITRISVIAHLLRQAQGRPAWALNLADLLVHQGSWQEVWTGKALRDQIRAFLRRSKAPAEAIQMLASIALVGDAKEDQARIIAKLLELSPTKFEELIRSVAIAGLVDVRRERTWVSGGGHMFHNSYRVVPSTIAASIVADIYFSGHAPAIRVSDIKTALPHLLPNIVQSQIHAALLGAENPMVPPPSELRSLLSNEELGPKANELLRSYALLNEECARFVFEFLTECIDDAFDRDNEQAAVEATTVLAARVADSLRADRTEGIALFFNALSRLQARGWDHATPTKAIVEDVQDARTGDHPTSNGILKLCAAMESDQARGMSANVWLGLTVRILQPSFDGNYMSPEKINSFVLQSFTWSAGDMNDISNALKPGLGQRVTVASHDKLADLIGLIGKWVHVANGYLLSFGGVPSPEQQGAARRVAVSMCDAVAPQVTTPGIRALFNREASSLGIKLPEPDELFAALTADRDFTEDWQEDRRLREGQIDRALAIYVQQPPAAIMTWIIDNTAELAMVNRSSAAWDVMSRLSLLPDSEVWLRAALDHGLGRAAGPLINRCVETGTMTVPLATALLRDEGGRASLINSVIAGCDRTDVVTLVVNDLKSEDILDLDSAYALVDASESTRRKLFTHPNPEVRGGAAALWAVEMSYSAEKMPEDSDWVTAMSDFDVTPDLMRGHTQSQALKVLAKVKPEAYMDLLVRHVKAREGHNDFHEWGESARELSSAHRFTLWYRVQKSPMARHLFWVISSADVEWITSAVSDPAFPITLTDLLHSIRFQQDNRYPLKDLAIMLRPLRWQPDDLLWTLDVGTHWGEEHERLERHLETCRELADSPEPDLANLGQRGIEIFGPRAKEARLAARRAAVRGAME